MPSLGILAALALVLASGVGLVMIEERRIGALKADLAAQTARLNTCEEVEGIRDEIDALPDQDIINRITRGARAQ